MRLGGWIECWLRTTSVVERTIANFLWSALSMKIRLKLKTKLASRYRIELRFYGSTPTLVGQQDVIELRPWIYLRRAFAEQREKRFKKFSAAKSRKKLSILNFSLKRKNFLRFPQPGRTRKLFHLLPCWNYYLVSSRCCNLKHSSPFKLQLRWIKSVRRLEPASGNWKLFL